MILSASLKALAKFPCLRSERKATLSGHSEWITGDPGVRAFSGSETTGRGSYSTRIRSSASGAV